MAVAEAILLVCAAADGAWASFDERLVDLRAGLERSRLVELDLAQLFERAGWLARAAHEPERAQASFRVAAEQFRAMKRDAQAEAVEAASLASAQTRT